MSEVLGEQGIPYQIQGDVAAEVEHVWKMLPHPEHYRLIALARGLGEEALRWWFVPSSMTRAHVTLLDSDQRQHEGRDRAGVVTTYNTPEQFDDQQRQLLADRTAAQQRRSAEADLRNVRQYGSVVPDQEAA